MNDIQCFRECINKLKGRKTAYYITLREYNEIVRQWPEVAMWPELMSVNAGAVG